CTPATARSAHSHGHCCGGNARPIRAHPIAKMLVENGPIRLRPPVSWYTIFSCKEVKDGHGGRVCTCAQSTYGRRARHPPIGSSFPSFAAEDPRDPSDAGTKALRPAQGASLDIGSAQVHYRRHSDRKSTRLNSSH